MDFFNIRERGRKIRSVYDELTSEGRRCFDHLRSVSRSFSFVIMDLPPSLRNSVCCFYLLMRSLDSIEDDAPSLPIEVRGGICRDFHETLSEKEFETLSEEEIANAVVNEDYRKLLMDLGTVRGFMDTIPGRHKEIIREGLKTCGGGMAKFLDRDFGSKSDKTGISTMGELDEYCYYVAGVVGVGMGRMISTCEGETPLLNTDVYQPLMIHNALLLQKTNIIRDYRQDISRGKAYWPRTWPETESEFLPGICSKFLPGTLEYLNRFVEYVLETHLPPTIANLGLVNSPEIFHCCALPSAMAVATLVTCYNNRSVFEDQPVRVSPWETGMVSRVKDIRGFVDEVNLWLEVLREKLSPGGKKDLVESLKKRCNVVMVHGMQPGTYMEGLRWTDWDRTGVIERDC